jgi:hypothetical protein
VVIHAFAGNQNDVFLRALVAVLVATVALCCPIVFAPTMRRRGLTRPVVAVSVILAVAALTVAGWQAGIGFRTLSDERAQVQSEIQHKFGLRLTSGQVDELVNGGRPSVSLPDRARALGLKNPETCKALHFKTRTEKVSKTITRVVPNTYDLTLGGAVLPVTGPGDDVAPVCVPPRNPSS